MKTFLKHLKRLGMILSILIHPILGFRWFLLCRKEKLDEAPEFKYLSLGGVVAMIMASYIFFLAPPFGFLFCILGVTIYYLVGLKIFDAIIRIRNRDALRARPMDFKPAL